MSSMKKYQLVGNDQSEIITNSSPDDIISPSIELEQLSEYEGNRINENNTIK